MKIRLVIALSLIFFGSFLTFAQELNCVDGIDDDSDGLIDCQDPDCPSCAAVFACTAPYSYYMPPLFGSRAGGSYSASLYAAEDLVLSTLGRAATVTIRRPDGTVLQTVTVPVANPVNIAIDGTTIPTAQIMRPNGDLNRVLSNVGLIITSDQPLQAAYRHLAANNQDLLQLQGRASLGRSFYAASQTDMNAGAGSAYERHFVSVMAIEDGTQVSFKVPTTATLHNGTSVNVDISNGSDNTTSALTLPAGRTITVSLNKGETYMIATMREDITVTGILVTSNKEIVVNSGSQHTGTSQGTDQDGGFQQLVPTQALETSYIAVDGGNTAVKDYVVIVAIENSTTFTVNGVAGGTDGRSRAVPTSLSAGQHFTYYFDDTNSKAYYVSANKRIYVYHASAYGTSEFGMDILPPINECIGSKQLDFERPGTNAAAFVIIPTSGLSSLRFRNQPYTTYAASIDPDGTGPLGTAQANTIGTSGYSYIVFSNANIAAAGINNRVTSDEKFHIGVNSRSGGTGNYAFFSNYEKSIEILDPNSLQTTNYYIAGQVAPGTPVKHCVILSGCGASNVITEATVSGWGGPGTEGTVTFDGSCVTYTMQLSAPSCATETVSLVAKNEFGIESQVCLVFENSTRPFTIGDITPSNAFFCSTGFPNSVTLSAPINVPSGTPIFTWTAPNGTSVTPTNSGTSPSYTTSISGTQSGTYKLNVAVGGCSQTIEVVVGSLNCTDKDGDAVANFADLDDDNDGVTDLIESGGYDPTSDTDSDGTENYRDATPGGTLPVFTDLNADGINDTYDYDLDGIINAFDFDSDNDGIPDVIESGGVDANGDGIIDTFTDTDTDGLSQNLDGNNTGSASSGNALGSIDTDGDGVLNIFDLDSDNDGIPDIIEAGGVDNDNNGLADSQSDANGNGFVDVYDSNTGSTGTPLTATGADTNSDGRTDSYVQDNLDKDSRPNYLDIDSDSDGIIDFIEAGFTDSDNNGVPDGAVGIDGWSDAVDILSLIGLPNSDSHGNEDYLDTDADNDGIPDIIEGQTTAGYIVFAATDTDADGLDNAFDNNDAAYGGNINNGIQPVNSDGIDNADFKDTDSDNDGDLDRLEGWDTDGNGLINGTEKNPGTLDSEGDGLLDNYDADDVNINPTNATTPLSYPDLDDVGNDRDWREPYNYLPVANNDAGSTNEAVTVLVKVVLNDTDSDGTVNVASVDLNLTTAGIQNTITTLSGTWNVDALGEVSFTPAANFSGAAAVQYKVNDNEGGTSNAATITITVNDSPVAVNDNQTTNEDTPLIFDVLANDTDSDGTLNTGSVDLDPSTAGVQNTLSGADGNWSVNGTGIVTFTPHANFNGLTSLGYTVADDDLATSNIATITITVTAVNDNPVAVNDSGSGNEDNAVTVNVTTNDTDLDGTINVASVDLDPLTIGIQTSFTDTNGSWSVSNVGVVTYTPNTNFNGTETTTYTVNDNFGGTSNAATISVTINAVNDEPTFVKGSNQTTNEDAVAQTVNAWAASILKGGSDESSQTLTFTLTNDNNSLFSAQPAISATGVLTYTPAANANGSATVSVILTDNGGTANGGDDTYATQTFTITVNAVNDEPSFTKGANETVNEDAVAQTVNAWATSILKGASDESSQTLTFTLTNDNNSLFSAQPAVSATGVLTYTPAANANGSATVSVILTDNGGTANGGDDTYTTQTFTIAVNAVNDEPSFTKGANQSVSEDAGAQTVSGWATVLSKGPSNESVQTLSFTMSNDNNSLFSAQPAISATGVLTYTPAANANGSATVSVILTDNGGTANGGDDTYTTQTFTIAVTAVNDNPVAVNDSGSGNEDNAVTVNVTTNDTDLDGTINVASVDLDPSTVGIQTSFTDTNGSWSVSNVGVVTYTPNTNFNGTETTTYTVNDNLGGTSNAATISVTINAVNDEPTFVKGSNQTTNEDATAQTVNAWATSILKGASDESSQTLTFTLTNDNNSLFSAQPAISATGVLTYTPAANANGSATVSVILTDNGGTANGGDDTYATQTFTITVNAVNDEPSFTKGANETVNEDAVAQTVNAWATSILKGASDESSQTLTFTLTNDNNSLFSAQPAVSATGVLTYTPAANANGSATVSVILTDNGGTANGGDDTYTTQTFTIAVNAVNDEPSFTKGANQSVSEDAGAQTVSGWATVLSKGPSNESVQTLSFTMSNDNNSLFSAQPAISATGVLTYTPAANANGSATVSVILTDNGGTANGGDDTYTTQTFTIAVTAVNDNPVAVNDSGSGNEDNAVTVNVTTNDTDLDGTINVASVDLDPSTVGIQTSFTDTNGSWSVSNVGVVTYTPNTNFNGTETTTYTVNDNLGGTSNAATISVTINAVNDEPTFVKGSNQTTNEDAVAQTVNAWATSILKGGSDESSQALTFTLTNDNNSLFSAQPAISATGVLTYTPAANANGSATVSVILTDNGGTANGGDDTYATQTFTITVNAVNDEPSFVKGADQSVIENAGAQTVNGWATAISKGASDESGQSLTFAVTNDNNALFSAQPAISTTGVLTYTPTASANGSVIVTVILSDNGGTTNGGDDTYATQTFTITVTPVNDDPVAVNDSGSGNEDNAVTVNVTTNDTDLDGTINVASVDLDPSTAGIQTSFTDTNGSWSVSNLGVVTYTPNTNFNGTETTTYTVNDNLGGTSNAATISVTINAVNDEPTFVKGSDQTTNEDATAQTVNAWATSILKGGSDESSQTLTFTLTNDNNSLFSAQPAISATGVLTYTPAANANGSATASVILTDNGGTANGGDDTYTTQTFTIAVNAVNDEPSFTKGANQSVSEDAGAQTVSGWATALSKGPSNESGQALSFTVSNDNNSLFSTQPTISATGVLTYTPAANANGNATVSVVLKDDGGVADGGDDTYTTQTFTIAVGDTNDEPTFSKGPDQAIDEDAGAQTVTAWATSITPGENENTQTITFVLTNDNNSLFTVQPTIDASGNLSYTPAANASGSSIVSVVLQDNGGTANGGDDTFTVQTFTITFNAVNDEPSFTTGGNETVNEDAGSKTVLNWATDISPGPPNESSQTVMFNVTNDNNVLFSTQPAIDANGNLTYTLAANTSGSANVSIVVTDDGGTTNGGDDTFSTQVFTIKVNPVNDEPSFVVGFNQSVTENTGALTINAWATLISKGTSEESGQTLTFTVTNDNNSLFLVQPAIDANGNLSYTTAENIFGTAIVSVILTDDGGTANGGDDTFATKTFTIVIIDAAANPVANDDSQSTNEDAEVEFDIALNDVDDNENLDVLSVDLDPSIAGKQSNMITTEGVWSVSNEGKIIFKPNLNFNGTAAITYTIGDTDGNVSNIGTVTVSVQSVNDAPVVDDKEVNAVVNSFVTGSLIAENDHDPDGTSIIVNQTPLAGPTHGTIIINSDGTYTYTANPGYTGIDIVTFEVCDSGLPLPGICVTRTLTITVLGDSSGDTDGDGINDLLEIGSNSNAPGDADHDGVPNYLDIDSDNDGITDGMENNANATLLDSDNDNIPNFLDDDSDNDGIKDALESGGQLPLNLDSDNDGIDDAFDSNLGNSFTSLLQDTDGDSSPDYLDEDDDQDGILTATESTLPDQNLDHDQDGHKDYLDKDDDNDGILTAAEDANGDGDFFNDDCDGDQLADYLDPDQCKLKIELGFSPNGDNNNDTWQITNIEEYPNNAVRIYNRWGNLIYEVKAYNNANHAWGGESSGKWILSQDLKVPDGTYFYVIDLGDGSKTIGGFIVLKR
jgi:gliding motility-associated-like protein